MAQKRSEQRYDKNGQVRYLVYKSSQPLRDGRSQERQRVKRFYLPGDSKDVSIDGPKTVEKRTGRKVHGVEVNYRHKLSGAQARRGKTSFKTPERWSEKTKVLELPDSARNVRLTNKPPAGPRMAVA